MNLLLSSSLVLGVIVLALGAAYVIGRAAGLGWYQSKRDFMNSIRKWAKEQEHDHDNSHT